MESFSSMIRNEARMAPSYVSPLKADCALGSVTSSAEETARLEGGELAPSFACCPVGIA